jgi:hypothetical protein
LIVLAVAIPLIFFSFFVPYSSPPKLSVSREFSFYILAASLKNARGFAAAKGVPFRIVRTYFNYILFCYNFPV